MVRIRRIVYSSISSSVAEIDSLRLTHRSTSGCARCSCARIVGISISIVIVVAKSAPDAVGPSRERRCTSSCVTQSNSLTLALRRASASVPVGSDITRILIASRPAVSGCACALSSVLHQPARLIQGPSRSVITDRQGGYAGMPLLLGCAGTRPHAQCS